VGHGSSLYNERDRQGIFYAESWALCHYMMIGDSNAREAQMFEYTTLINQGVASDEAFARAFKSSTAEVEKLLKNYIRRNTYTANTYKLPSIEGERDFSVNPISEAELQYYLGNLLARTNRIDEAEVLLKRAKEMDPQLAGPYEGLGFVAIRRNRFGEALEHFKQAVTRGSKNHLTHYYYADALLRQIIGSVRPPVAKQIAGELRTSIKLMPGFAFAHYALANLALMTQENLKEGLEAATIAIKLEPQNKRFALALAQLQVQTQDYEAAKKTLEPLLSADVEPKLKESAESTMKMLEERTRMARVEQPSPEPKQNSGPPKVVPESKQNTDPAKSASEPPSQQAEKAPAWVSQPTRKLEGTQTIRGVLVAIECRAGKWTLVVNARGSRIRFAVSNKDKLEFYSQDPSFEGSVRCGPVNKNAFIYFKPMAGQTRLAGDAVAVEFT
jgi:tetratricopeptide (TPR) repeat protein